MLRCVVRLILAVVMVAFASAANAECVVPAPSGLALCFPSVGSTVLYPATMELAANTGGVGIAHVSVYDNSVKMDDFSFLPKNLIDFGIKNGFHHITVNAWDAHGKLYQAKSSFTVTGFGVGQCKGGSATVTLCSPAQGSYQPESAVTISAAFAPGVKSWKVTVDGKAFINSGQTGQPPSAPLLTGTYADAGSHTLVISAVNGQGVTSTVTRRFFTFYDRNCPENSATCSPGIEIIRPSNISTVTAGDEATSFRLQAEVVDNPKPTTKMLVYLNGVKIQQSAGPGITVDVTASKGTHYIVIQAWDTTGRLYETYGNVNLQ
jgi:hypothetical protein